jgi:hypothetical protein
MVRDWDVCLRLVKVEGVIGFRMDLRFRRVMVLERMGIGGDM